MSAQQKIDAAQAILDSGILGILTPDEVKTLNAGIRLMRLRAAVAEFLALVQEYPDDALEIANDVKNDPLFAPMMELLK